MSITLEELPSFEEAHQTPESMVDLINEFTSTSSKIPWHRDIIDGLHQGKGVPKVSGIFIGDLCQHKCAFCSTANRAKDSLTLHQVEVYLNQLQPLGLKAVILSGGGNPILWKDKETGQDFNDLVAHIHDRGIQVGLITNGLKNMPTYECGRKSWKTVRPETLDKLTWIRISLSAWDHGEEVEVPDINPDLTTLGGSWVYHDQYIDPSDRHGKVSRPEDLKTPLLPGEESTRVIYGKDRLPFIKQKLKELLANNPFSYIRALPNCYEIQKIPERCSELEKMALEIDPRVAVQYKPPSPHTCCLLGYSHPVLWPSGDVTPCDSVTLLDASNRSQGGQQYVIGRWDTIHELYEKPVQSLIDPMVHCRKCVFGAQNRALDAIWKGADPQPEGSKPLHVNFI
jgi:hypothetical protein